MQTTATATACCATAPHPPFHTHDLPCVCGADASDTDRCVCGAA